MDERDTHTEHMRRALSIAARGWGQVSPNPMVGVVIVDAAGATIGEGWYEGPRGAPHAEIRALREAGEHARGATAYCSLEPCDHHAATPPCTQALIDAGVSRVVVAALDLNPLVDGRGIARLRGAGIEVIDGPLAEEAHRLNAAFERHVTTGMPFVVFKSAASLDGKTAAADGTSRWITSQQAREDAHRLRAWADAVVVGAGTVVADDPRLTARVPDLPDAWQPLRVVVDAGGRVPATAAVFDGEAPTLVATTERAPEDRIRTWQAAGAEVTVLETDAAERVSAPALARALGKRDVQGALLEGGATLAWSFLRDGLVDRIVQYLAPVVIGGASAQGVVAGVGFAPIDHALRLSFERVERIGPDLRVEADVHRDH
ncbi:MAG TPA: bifunctional diaminohydroxyphosphoribosylaminopyrimidine deaminase/5-amino-6-(5-phosphoribosylamino)uracil reductase RibD [Actinomycetota bacterium]|nr:bifunctional diaminohydroxyphosphoribosylaminopyrimidine deaminase/5-amino-6-(5-phosphoribosylamino)uracil reductase RibD [Actinomycetota bacterium]